MNNVKVSFRLGGIEFSAEGTETWVESQLTKLLEYGQKNNVQSNPVKKMGEMESPPGVENTKTLASYLRDSNATTNQVRKFLATAVWLHGRGNKRLKTSDVAKALKDSSQSRLSNPSECLAKNVSKGLCDKDGTEFYVTSEGHESIADKND